MSRLDPYGDWLKVPQDRRGTDGTPLTYYDLLLLRPEEATPERVMKAAMEQSAEVRNYASTPEEGARQWVERLRGEIAEALICLSDPDKRKQYDRKHFDAAEVVPCEDDKPGPPNASDSARSAPADADWSEDDRLILEWLMQGAKRRGPEEARAAGESVGPGSTPAIAEADRLGSEWVSRHSDAYGPHLKEWMHQVVKEGDESRFNRRLGFVAAACMLFFMALMGVTAIVGGLGPSTVPSAQFESKRDESAQTPSEAPSSKASPASSPKSSLESGDVVSNTAASRASKGQDSPARSVTLTLPEIVNEGDTVALKSEVGARAMPVRYPVTIDWGDGAAPEEAYVRPNSSTPGAYLIEGRHVYADNGDWEVRLATRPDYGDRTLARQMVKVRNVAPKVTIKRCEVGSRDVVRVEASVTEPGVNDRPLAEVLWGDGAAEFLKVAPVTGGEWEAVGKHAYPKDGVYTIEITVTDKDEGMGEARQTVSISGARYSGGPVSHVSPSPAKAANDKWFAVIVYNDRKVLDTAVVLGKARAQTRAATLRLAARDNHPRVEVIEANSRAEAEVAIEQFRVTLDALTNPRRNRGR